MNILISIKNLTMEFPIYENYSVKIDALKTLIGGVFKKDKNKLSVKSLDNISLNLSEGDKVGIVGHNGSGKTTLLRLIDKTYYPTSGTIDVKSSVCSLTDINLGLDDELTGLENIYLLLKLYEIKATKSIVNDIIKFSELYEFIHLPVNKYSSGMKLRLSFSIACFNRKNIIIMDEWISTGDQNFERKITKKLKDMIKKTQLLIIASHNQIFLKKLCNKIIYLNSGKVSKILKKIKNTWVDEN